jgi:hypothetical protein
MPTETCIIPEKGSESVSGALSCTIEDKLSSNTEFSLIGLGLDSEFPTNTKKKKDIKKSIKTPVIVPKIEASKFLKKFIAIFYLKQI